MKRRQFFSINLLLCVLLVGFLLLGIAKISDLQNSFSLRCSVDKDNPPAMISGLNLSYDLVCGQLQWTHKYSFMGTYYDMEWDFHRKYKDQNTPEPVSGKTDVLPDGFTLPEGARLLYQGSNASGSCVLLLVSEGDSAWFYVLRGENAECLLKTELSLAEGPVTDVLVNEMDNGLAVLLNNRRLCVLYEQPEGKYELRINAAVDVKNAGLNDGVDEYPFWYEGNLTGLCAFDGRRLAKAYFTKIPGADAADPNAYDGGFGLIIYDASGVVFCGRFKSGFDRCNIIAPGWTGNVRPAAESFRMHWGE